MHDVILTALEKTLIPRIEMAVKSITGSSGDGPNSEVQNPDPTDFLGNAANFPLMSASSRLELNTNQDRNGETHKEENFEDGDFPALGLNHGRTGQSHHMMTWHIIPHSSFPEHLTGQFQTQNDPLSQQIFQQQNMATHISPDNTLPMIEQTPQRQNSDSSNHINRLAEAIEGNA